MTWITWKYYDIAIETNRLWELLKRWIVMLANRWFFRDVPKVRCT